MENAAVAQSVERRIGSAEVTGPIPVSSFGERAGDFGWKGLPYFKLMKIPQKSATGRMPGEDGKDLGDGERKGNAGIGRRERSNFQEFY